jgi:hypothetical protein
MEAGGVEAVVPSYGGRELAAADLQFSVTAGTEEEHVGRHRQPRPTGHSARTVSEDSSLGCIACVWASNPSCNAFSIFLFLYLFFYSFAKINFFCITK